MEPAIDYTMSTHAPVSMGVETITPTKAQQMLDDSASFANRSLRKKTIALYAREMREGQWRMVYDPIRVDSMGRVIDGQHRLHAIVEAGESVPMMVVRGLPTEASNFVDVGMERKRPDFLRMYGLRNANVTAAALNWLHRYHNGTIASSAGQLPRTMMSAAYEATPGIDLSVELALSMYGICRRGAIMGGAHYLFSQVGSKEEADAFMARVRDGEELVSGDPEYALRKRLIETERGRRDSDVMLSALVIKAWNARREGRPMKALKWDSREAFPVAI